MNQANQQILKFPEGFLWGVSTSAFQIEGSPEEILNRTSDWAHWTNLPGKITDNSSADKACEFYSRHPEDIELAASLNQNAFRIGLNWATLCPKPSAKLNLDPVVLEYYRNLLGRIKKNGMKTFVTLFHFCLPKWLSDIGGWNNPRTVDEFEKFAGAIVNELGDLVDYWLTLNEPMVYIAQGYVTGAWPPGYMHNYYGGFAAVRKLLEGHARAYRVIKRADPNAQISFNMHWRPFVARNKFNPLDQLVRYYRDQVFHHVFLQAIQTGNLQFPFPLDTNHQIEDISGFIPNLKQSMDYLAINYFTREICEFDFTCPTDIFGKQSKITKLETTSMGWEIFPEGLYYLLTEDLAAYRLDAAGNRGAIFITENGMATNFSPDLNDGDWSLDDEQRVQYLKKHLMAIHKAIAYGANVKGYLHWSLLDNFEWADGLSQRFGLVRINYHTQERTPRKSAKLYAEIAKNNAIVL